MVNLVWLLLLLVGIITAALSGKIDQVTVSALEAAELGIAVAIQLMGVMSSGWVLCILPKKPVWFRPWQIQFAFDPETISSLKKTARFWPDCDESLRQYFGAG